MAFKHGLGDQPLPPRPTPPGRVVRTGKGGEPPKKEEEHVYHHHGRSRPLLGLQPS